MRGSLGFGGSASALAGLGNLASGNWLGFGCSAPGYAVLMSVVGGVMTTLATSPLGIPGGLSKYDLQVINYGSAATLNLYINGTFYVSYTGNVSLTGAANLDCVVAGFTNRFTSFYVSEVIVANESTLGFQGLATLAPNGNGATQQWSNPGYTNVNPTTINDANATYTNTVGQDEQLTTNNTPAGTYQIKAVKVIARAQATAGSTATGLKLGFNNTNNATVAEGGVHTLGSGFSPVEEYFTTDPTTGSAWGPNLNGYQIEIKSE